MDMCCVCKERIAGTNSKLKPFFPASVLTSNGIKSVRIKLGDVSPLGFGGTARAKLSLCEQQFKKGYG